MGEVVRSMTFVFNKEKNGTVSVSCDSLLDFTDEYLEEKYGLNLEGTPLSQKTLEALWQKVKKDTTMRNKMNKVFIDEQKRMWQHPEKYWVSPKKVTRNLTDVEYFNQFKYSTGYMHEQDTRKAIETIHKKNLLKRVTANKKKIEAMKQNTERIGITSTKYPKKGFAKIYADVMWRGN